MSDNGHYPPPHNIEAERALIGSALIDNDVLVQVQVKPTDFYQAFLGKVWGAMRDLVHAGKSADIITLPEVLTKRDICLQPGFLIDLVAGVPTSINAPDYADIIRADAQRRAVIRLSQKAATDAYNGAQPIDDLLADTERALLEVRQKDTSTRLTKAKQNASQFITDLQSDKITTVPTHYLDLDRAIGGLEKGSVYWFCAAEKMGKTAFVSRISLHNALNRLVVVRFSLEMSARQRTRRDIAMMTKIPITALKQKHLTKEQWAKAFEAAGRLSECALIIDETPGIKPAQMRASLNRVLMDYGRIDLIEYDYFQLGEADTPSKNRVTDLEYISRQMANIAREYDAPVIGTAQVLSKAIDNRSNKRPLLSDVHGSAALAKDGYMIAFLYRDEYYNPDSTDTPNQGELMIRAHRDGDTPTIGLYFDGPTAEYRNLKKEKVTL